MAITVEIGGTEATIEDYQWSSEDKTLQGLLSAMLNPNGASGSDPDPDMTAALAAIKELGGRIVKHTGPDPEDEQEKGRIY